MATAKSRRDSLYDLIDHDAVTTGKSVFNVYKPKKEIGKEIFKELYKRFQGDERIGETGFYMDDSNEIGILSQCQSLQALLTLTSDFDLSFDDKHLVSEEEENLTIREIMDMVIEDVLYRIKTSTPNVYCFDASPYETKLFTVQYSNVEAITWIIPCFLQALKYHARIGETCKWQEQLVSVISYGLKYLNESYILSDDHATANSLKCGWNFTKNCEEPSLYYTFAVCECYIDFYNSFKELLDYLVAEKKNNEHFIPIPKRMESKHKKHLENYEKLLQKGDLGYNDKGKKLAQFDEYNELFLRYKEINNGIEKIEGSLFGEFENCCKVVAREIWRLSKDRLADDFFYNDLHTTLNDEDIEISTTSDALFNSVYMINIMVDVGLAEELKFIQDTADTDEKRLEAERDYNNFFESCQLANQKAFRTYEKLKNIGKEYIVEQFLVGFNERFIVHKEIVKELRKRRMRVFSLMPLLIKTNNVISERLIKYPQANMKKYLGYIMDNRYDEDGEDKWIWEKDGFFSCSNYYYVSALGEFYAYYEEYESEYIDNYNENLAQREAILAKQLDVLNGPNGDIGSLKRELQDKKKEVEKLKEEIKNVSTPVEDAVVEVIAKEMQKNLPKLLSEFIMDSAKGITTNDVDDTPCKEEHKAFANAMNSFIVAMISDFVYRSIQSGKLSKAENIEKHNELTANVKKDIIRCVQRYIAEIKDSSENRSSFYNKD